MSQLEFDRRLIQRLERLYSTRDVLRRRGLVRAALGARSGDRILDVGCGPGFYITELGGCCPGMRLSHGNRSCARSGRWPMMLI